MTVNYRRIDDSNVAEVCVLSWRVFHLHDRLANALQVIQRVFENAVVLGARTVRSHRDDRNHVAVVVVDDNVVVIRVPGWRGYGDGVVVKVMIIGTASGRSISIAKLAAWHQTFVFDVDCGYEVVFNIWCWRRCTKFSCRCNRRCCSWCWICCQCWCI